MIFRRTATRGTIRPNLMLFIHTYITSSTHCSF